MRGTGKTREMECPNCGHQLVPYRRQRQPAGVREVILEWMICRDCRHVALSRWDFAEAEQDEKTSTDGEDQREWHERTRHQHWG